MQKLSKSEVLKKAIEFFQNSGATSDVMLDLIGFGNEQNGEAMEAGMTPVDMIEIPVGALQTFLSLATIGHAAVWNQDQLLKAIGVGNPVPEPSEN